MLCNWLFDRGLVRKLRWSTQWPHCRVSGEIDWLSFFETLNFCPVWHDSTITNYKGHIEQRWCLLLSLLSLIPPSYLFIPVWHDSTITEVMLHMVRWWNRLNLLSLIPYHSFLELFDVIQPVPLNVDLVKLFCQLWWDSIWWLAFTCDWHSAVSYLWYFRLNTTTAAQSDDKEKNQQLWALSYSDTLCRKVFFILFQILIFFETLRKLTWKMEEFSN